MDVLHSSRKRHGSNHSRFIGVTLAQNKYWTATAFANGKKIYIGTFKIEEDAAHARDRYILKNIGEDVVLNFPRFSYSNDVETDKPKNRRYGPRPPSANNKSGYKGVYWNNQSLKWHASVFYQGKNISAGMFVDKIDAARAHDRKAIELLRLHGLHQLPAC